MSCSDIMSPAAVFYCLQIREELRANGIDVYPQKEFDEDAEDRMINDKIRVSPHRADSTSGLFDHYILAHYLHIIWSVCRFSWQEMIPFAVVGSDQEYQVNGKRILGRKTKWGTIEGKEKTRHNSTFSIIKNRFLLVQGHTSILTNEYNTQTNTAWPQTWSPVLLYHLFSFK